MALITNYPEKMFRSPAENWARKNPVKGIVYDNLRLIRAFEDPEGSEKGFILVHVSVISFTSYYHSVDNS